MIPGLLLDFVAFAAVETEEKIDDEPCNRPLGGRPLLGRLGLPVAMLIHGNRLRRLAGSWATPPVFGVSENRNAAS